MTFSVVARDAVTGDVGIAVSSCILAVGRAVPSVRPGVGVVAVQARSRRGLGGALLAGLAAGADPADLVKRAAHAAEDADRQVAVLDVSGRIAADTGQGSLPVSGHRIGDGFAVQGNMLASPDVLPAMAEACAAARGDLPGRLLAALAEAEPALPPPWRPQQVPADVLELVGPWYWGPTPLLLTATPDGGLRLAGMQARARACRFARGPAPGTWTGLDGYYAGETLRVVRDAAGTVRHLDLASFRLTRTPYPPREDVPRGVHPAGWGPLR